MNDKDRDLIQQILQAAGTAGEKGFGYLVHWKMVDGATDVIASLAILAFVIWAFRRALVWKSDDDDIMTVRGVLLILLSVAGLFAVCGGLTGVTSMLAPEGAAIHSVLHK